MLTSYPLPSVASLSAARNVHRQTPAARRLMLTLRHTLLWGYLPRNADKLAIGQPVSGVYFQFSCLRVGSPVRSNFVNAAVLAWSVSPLQLQTNDPLLQCVTAVR